MRPQEVAIFWDYENCPSPTGWSGYEVVRRIRYLVQDFGPVKLFKAYLSISEQSQLSKATLRSELQASGVSLTDTPHNGRKEVADKMIIVDMLTHAMDNPAPATIFLISGDRDYAYAISVLRLRQYEIVLITHANAHSSLTSQASVCFEWATDILGATEPTPATQPSSSSESDTAPTDFKFPSLKFVPGPKSPGKPLYSTASPLKQGSKETSYSSSRGPNGPEDLGLRSPIQGNFEIYRSNASTCSVDLRPPSPTEDLFNGFYRSSRPTPNTQSDPFALASRSYPSPQLSSMSVVLPETPTSSQGDGDSTFRISRPVTPLRPQSAAAQVPKSPPKVPSFSTPSVQSTSSSYVSAPEELLLKQNRPVIFPPQFKPLVKLLQAYHERGNPQPFRPSIASELVSANKTLFDELPGVETFKQYAELAQKHGIVELGPGWISLRSGYLKADVS